MHARPPLGLAPTGFDLAGVKYFSEMLVEKTCMKHSGMRQASDTLFYDFFELAYMTLSVLSKPNPAYLRVTKLDGVVPIPQYR